MNTKIIMSSSALSLALIGIGFTFFGAEIAELTGTILNKNFQLILQILGALYFAFAMLNWMAKGSAIGGIYNRPIAIANFSHFFIGGLSLLKAIIGNPGLSYGILVFALMYALFAILFGLLLSRNPVGIKKLSTLNG